MKIGTVYVTIAAMAIAVAGCLGGGGPVEEREVLVVELDEALELYSTEGCADLENAGLAVSYADVLGAEGLVAVVAEGTVLCVRDADPLRWSGAAFPHSRDGSTIPMAPGVPTCTTESDEEPSQEPHPEPAQGGPSIAGEPHPEPATPTRPIPAPPSS